MHARVIFKIRYDLVVEKLKLLCYTPNSNLVIPPGASVLGHKNRPLDGSCIIGDIMATN